MADQTVSEDTSELFRRLGQLVMFWNRAEETTRLLIRDIATGEPHDIDTLTAHMGSIGLCDALRTLSNDTADTKLNSCINHFIKYFEIMREYRNYYVHSLVGIEGGEGVLMSISARSNLSLHTESVLSIDVADAAHKCFQLQNFGAAIHDHIINKSENLPSLDKLVLPVRLEKPRTPIRDI